MDKETQNKTTTVDAPLDAQVTKPDPVISRYSEVYVKHNPDKEFPAENQEDFFISDYDAKCTRIAEMMADNQTVADAIMAEPTLAEIISDVINGMPFEVALAKNVDLESIKPLDDEPTFDQFKEVAQERKKRQAEIKESKKTIEANLELARKTADEFFEDEGIEEEDRNKFVDFVDSIILEVLNGNFSKSSLKKMLQAYRYDDDLSAASTQGEVNGRNATIETKRQINTVTDGLAETGSGAKPQPQTTVRKIFNIE